MFSGGMFSAEATRLARVAAGALRAIASAGAVVHRARAGAGFVRPPDLPQQQATVASHRRWARAWVRARSPGQPGAAPRLGEPAFPRLRARLHGEPQDGRPARRGDGPRLARAVHGAGGRVRWARVVHHAAGHSRPQPPPKQKGLATANRTAVQPVVAAGADRSGRTSRHFKQDPRPAIACEGVIDVTGGNRAAGPLMAEGQTRLR